MRRNFQVFLTKNAVLGFVFKIFWSCSDKFGLSGAFLVINYPRESFREGLCNHRRWFVCLLVRLSVCYHDN